MTLVIAVTNILHKRVTEAEAQKFALDNYGVLCAYIRSQQVKELLELRKYEARLRLKEKAKKRAVKLGIE